MGWFDETTRTFEVYNQPLYTYPDTRDMFPPTLFGILKDEDPVVHMRRAMFSNINKTAIHKFRNDIDDGTYEYGWPTVETNFKINKSPELQAAVDDYYGTPVVIVRTNYGVPTIRNWVLSQLAKTPTQLGFEFHVCTDTFTDLSGLGDGVGEYHESTYSETTGKYTIYVWYDDVEGAPNVVPYYDVVLDPTPTDERYIVKVQIPVTGSGSEPSPTCDHPTDPGDGTTDYRLDGHGSFFMIHNDRYFYYYVGAEGERTDDAGPSWRRLHLMTSDNHGSTWTKHGLILPDFFPFNDQEEGHYDCFVKVEDDNTFTMYYGGMTQVDGQPGSVNVGIYRAISSDGISWTDMGLFFKAGKNSDGSYLDTKWTGEISPIGISDNGRYFYYLGKEGQTPDWGLGVYDTVNKVCTNLYVGSVLGSASGVMTVDGKQYLTFLRGGDWDGGWYASHEFWVYGLATDGQVVGNPYEYKIKLSEQAWPYLAYDNVLSKWIFVKSYYVRSNCPGDTRLMHHDVFKMEYYGNYDQITFLNLENITWTNYVSFLFDRYCRSWGYDCGSSSLPTEFECDYWVYDPKDGTYPDIQEPYYDFGSGGSVPEPFPEIPLRYRNENFDEEGSVLNTVMIEKQLDNVRLDGSRMISDIMDNEDIASDPNKVDNIFVKFHVRLYDESIAGRQYLYTFFKGLFDFNFETNDEEQPLNCKKLINPGDDPITGDYIIDDSACSSIIVRTDFHWYKFGFSTIRNTYYTMQQIAADTDLYNIYHSNYKSFDEYGNFNRIFYTSSGALLTPAGFTAENINDIDSWLLGGESGKKSSMKLPDDAPGKYWMKPANRIIRYGGLIYDSEGNILDTDELVPEYVYVRYELGGNTYPRVVPIEPPVAGIYGVSEITYYEVTENGMNAYTVYGAEATIQVQDTDTNTGSLVMLTPTDVNKITVPYFYGILLNDVGQHPATDGFITSLHLGVYVADVTVTEMEWWMIAIKVVGFVIALYTAYAGGFVWYQALLYATIMYMSAYYLAKIVFEIAADFGMLGQIIGAIILFVITRQMAGGGSLLPNVSTMSLPTMLLNFTKLLSGGFKVYSDLEKEQMLDDDLDFEEEKKVLEAEMAIAEMELAGNTNTSELIDSLMSDTRTSIQPMEPERYFQAQEDFVNIGISSLDYDSVYEEQFEFRTL